MMTNFIKENVLRPLCLIADDNEEPQKKSSPPSERKWHLTISLRLILGASVIVLLVACMSLISIRATSGLLDANQQVSNSLNKSASFQERVAEYGHWRQEIDATQANLSLTMRHLIAGMVDNHNELNGFVVGVNDPLGDFLNSAEAAEVKKQFAGSKGIFEKLQELHDSILLSSEELHDAWQPRHDGLAEELNTLKRHINYWNLKVANTIFLRSSMLEIMPEELGDTPVEEFRNSLVFQKFAVGFPILNEKVTSAANSNAKLYEASDKIAMLSLMGDWEKVRTFYRDNFPATIKSILVDIDQVIAIEQQSLHAQHKAMQILNEQLNQASSEATESLGRLQEMLQRALAHEKANLQNAAQEVMKRRDSMEGAISQVRKVNMLGPALIILLVVIGGIVMTRSVSRPLQKAVSKLNEIAEGGGDLTQEIPIRSGDEVGQLAKGFNKFMGRQREMVGSLRNMSVELTAASNQIRGTASKVSTGAKDQTVALSNSENSLKEVLQNTEEIAESTSQLVDSTRQCTSASMELGATIEEIAEQMDHLFTTVDTVSTSTQEMSASSNQIEENVQSLVTMSQQTAQAVETLNDKTSKIEESATTTGELAARAAEDAGRGMDAVETSLEGINKMSDVINKAGIVIRDLSDQSESIGQILTVIDDVADQTSLLALNATIIAAQAGERGKAFSVVADEIRDLANRTAFSTKEIAKIIRGLQNTASEAVEVVESGRERADKEVGRAQDAGQALEKIRQSTEDARWHVVGIVESAQEQVNDSQQINTSVQQFNEMLAQMAAALQQLSTGIKQTAKSSEDMREIAGRVKSSTEEQAAGSRHISENMETIRTMTARISESTSTQTERTEATVTSVTNIHRIARETVDKSGELETVVHTLMKQTETLETEVGTFKV
jgi:methyl-accepting chemotaxis protein